MATKLGKNTVKNVRNWIKALRSGKYDQGQAALCSNDCFCCLGVACDIMGVKYKLDHSNNRLYNFTSVYNNATFPSERFMKRNFGMDEPTFDQLADMNDRGSSFDEIADYIEEWLKERS